MVIKVIIFSCIKTLTTTFKVQYIGIYVVKKNKSNYGTKHLWWIKL